MSLIVTGSIGIDTVETPTGSVEEVLGGSCVYFAAAASFFGPVRVVGAVGDDFPDEHLDVLKQFDIDLAGLERRQGSRTFRWHGRYQKNMNSRETVSVEPNVLAEAFPPVPTSFRDSRYVFLANTHPAAQLELLEQFPDRKLAVADTMDLWIENERPALQDLLGRIDGLVLNNDEAEQLSNESNLIGAARQIVGMGPKFVVVKKGEHGALIEQDGARAVLPAYPAEKVVDPTGAGDSFAGGMMGYLAQHGQVSPAAMRRAMAYGTILASFNIESFSLKRLGQISREDIEQRFAEYQQILDIG